MQEYSARIIHVEQCPDRGAIRFRHRRGEGRRSGSRQYPSALSAIARETKRLITQSEAIRNAWVDAVSDSVMNYQLQDGQKKNAREGVQYSLRGYTEQQKKNWENSKRIVIYDNQQQLSRFISDSIQDKTMDKKMYFGSVPFELAARIKTDTGVDVENYNLSLGSYEVRKILKDHGNEAKEATRGQRAIVPDDFGYITDVVLNPTNITLSEQDYMGKPAIIFSGENNGRMNVVAVVSDKRLDLFVQTVYTNVKKGNLSTPTGEQAPINTPEANSSMVSSNKVSQLEVEVKENVQYSSRTQQDTQLDRLTAQNEKLRKETEYLRQLVQIQKSGNKDYVLDRNSVKQQAKALMDSVNAKGISEISGLLNDFYRQLTTEGPTENHPELF